MTEPAHPKVSIIVPVYNAEDYLAQCVESIVRQTYGDIELILVNDGSRDSSLSIARQYQSRDKRITVIDQPNGGVSNARNTGIRNASGDYLAFIDSDDYVDPDYIERLIAPMQHGYDMMCAALVQFNTEGEYTVYSLPTNNWDLSVEDDAVGFHKLYYNTSPVCKLYKRSIILDNGLWFNESMDFAEDFEFNLNYIRHISTAYSLDYVGYHYRKELADSLSAKQRDLTKVTNDKIRHWRMRKHDFEQRGHTGAHARAYLATDILKTVADYIYYLSASTCITAYRQAINGLDTSGLHEYIEANRDLVKYDTGLQRLIAADHKFTAFVLYKIILMSKRLSKGAN